MEHLLCSSRLNPACRRPVLPASLACWSFNCGALGRRKKNLIRGEQQAQAGPTARWEEYAHGTDIGVWGIGSTVEEAFEQAAVARWGYHRPFARKPPKH